MAEKGQKLSEERKFEQNSSDEEVLVDPKLRVTEEEKDGTIPGSVQADKIARNLSIQPINPMGRYRPPKKKKKKDTTEKKDQKKH